MLDFPATHRNREVIASVLDDVFGGGLEKRHLEVASGSGQHAVYFARRFPDWTIQPTDIEPDHLASITAYTGYHKLANVLPPRRLDVRSADWGFEGTFHGIWAINLVHISPWECTRSLFGGAGRYLAKDGAIYLYGAYRRGGEHTSESNRAFDEGLRAQNPEWGVRCLDEVTEVARGNGFELDRVVEMPANNLSVVFRRPPASVCFEEDSL